MKDYYRVRAEIDLEAICHNIRQVKDIVGEDVKVIPVIKADGYGHGAVPIAKIVHDKVGVYGFAVATLEEAIELRENEIIEPIMILGYTDESQYKELMRYKIDPTIYTYDMAKALSEVAKSLGLEVPMHIKLDTGMSRIGFSCETDDCVEEILKISKLDNVFIKGIFTHFACADETNKESATKQKERFDHVVNALEAEGISIPIKHVANSATIIDMKDWSMDMVRMGIITYGLWPSDEVRKENIDLKPAMAIRSHIVHLKELPAGQGVSYNHTYVTNKPTKIATIPVGYADGYPRSLSSKGRVLIRGQYAPIVGRVCMDQFMVDVTDIKDVELMDVVTLVGADGENNLSVEEVANLAGSFNYEFVCDISKRVPRVYQ